MKYKAIFLDLDGTTVPNIVDALPSARVTDAIAKARDVVHVCIATGRPLYKAVHILDHLNLSGPCVLCSGIHLYDPVKRQILQEHGIRETVVPELVAIAKDFGLAVFTYDGHEDRKLVEGISEGKTLSVYYPDIEPELVDAVEKRLSAVPGIAVHKMPSWNEGYLSLDITDAAVSKLHGIVDVFKILGVTKEVTIGVGDSYNDYPLLSACGLKIAMGNAVPEVKAIADFIAPPVTEDGVATIIEKYILEA